MGANYRINSLEVRAGYDVLKDVELFGFKEDISNIGFDEFFYSLIMEFQVYYFYLDVSSSLIRKYRIRWGA